MSTTTASTGATTPSFNPWPTFVVCAIASYITTLDLSIVNVAFAEIATDFPDTTRSTISWVVTAYSILFGSLLVVSGRMADRLGRRRMFLQGSFIFLVGSLLCAAAPGMQLLILGRAIQGVGGAMLTPASVGLLLSSFSLAQRSQVVAWTGAIGALGVASGPTLGAFLISQFGWRSAFWINIPICLFAIAMTFKVVRETPKQENTSADIVTSIVFTASMASLVWAISRIEEFGVGDSSVVFLLAIFVVLGLVVVRRSLTVAEPLLPPDLFKEQSFTAANIASFLFGAAFSGIILNNVLFLRTIWGYSVLRAGWFSVLSPLMVAVVSIAVGRVMGRIGFRRLLVGGPILFAITALGESVLLSASPTPWSRWIPLMFILGVGIGMTFPVLSAASVFRLPPLRFALGSAINNTFRQVGSAVGVALVVTVQTASDGVAGFHNGWRVCALAALVAAAVSISQPKFEQAAT